MHSVKWFCRFSFISIVTLLCFSDCSPTNSNPASLSARLSETNQLHESENFAGNRREKRQIGFSSRQKDVDYTTRQYEEEIMSMPTCAKTAPTDNSNWELWVDEPTLYTKLFNIAKSSCKKSSKVIQTYKDELQDTGKFKDLDYEGDSKALGTHTVRLCALMVSAPNSANVMKSFEFLTCTAMPPPSDNWWTHGVGLPTDAWTAAFVALKYLTRQQVVDYMDRWFKYSEVGPVWNPGLENDAGMSGANLGSRLFLGTIYAAVKGNLREFVDEADAKLRLEIVDRNGYKKNGIRPDGCLHQHSKVLEISKTEYRILSQPHGSNYGKEFYKMVSRAMMLLSYSNSFRFDKSTEQEMINRFFDCQAYLHRGPIAEPTTAGRFIDSGEAITVLSAKQGIYKTATYFKVLNYRKEELNSVIARYESAIPATEHALVLNKFFFSSDMMVHHRQNYFASLRMTSRRTLRPEIFKEQNILGYYQGDGWISFLVSAKEFGERDAEIFQQYDWTKVPGVTCKQVDEVETVYFKESTVNDFFNNGSFVGGVSNSVVGLSAMLLDRPTTEVKAQKSWFFFSDSVVALGSNIYKDSEVIKISENVATTVNQVLAGDSFSVKLLTGAEETQSFTDDFIQPYEASWVHHDTMGYVFLAPSTAITVKMDANSNPSVNLFTVYIDHGALVSQPASYSFIYLPDATKEETNEFSENSPVKIVEQTDKAHVVCHATDKAVGIAMWQPKCTDLSLCLEGFIDGFEICSDVPIVMMISKLISDARSEELCWNVTVADPQQVLAAPEVTLSLKFTQSGQVNEVERTIALPKDAYSGSSEWSVFCNTDDI